MVPSMEHLYCFLLDDSINKMHDFNKPCPVVCASVLLKPLARPAKAWQQPEQNIKCLSVSLFSLLHGEHCNLYMPDSIIHL